MSNENHNKPDWKNKLEDDNALSAEILQNKNIAWGKLHNRLQEKPRRKKLLWYWIAAACLLPAIFISLVYLMEKDDKALKNIVIKAKAVKPEMNEMQYIKADTVATGFAKLNSKKKTLKINRKSNNNNKIANTDKEHFDTNIQITDNEISSPFLVADSSNFTNIVKAQPKKKLKVIHINELGEPAEELPFTEHNANTNLHYFQLKLANQEVYRSTSLASNNTGINLFKTKISPPN